MNAVTSSTAAAASEGRRPLQSLAFAAAACLFAMPATAQVYVEQVAPRMLRDPAIDRTAPGAGRLTEEREAILASRSLLPAGGGGSSAVLQDGRDNRASADLQQPNLNRTQQSQSGDRNISAITMSGTNNVATILQEGNGNSAATPLGIAGQGNSVFIGQRGNDNAANVSTPGGQADGNRIDVSQQGNANHSSVIVLGRDNLVTHSQTGSGLSQSINVVGTGRPVTIQQFSLPK